MPLHTGATSPPVVPRLAPQLLLLQHHHPLSSKLLPWHCLEYLRRIRVIRTPRHWKTEADLKVVQEREMSCLARWLERRTHNVGRECCGCKGNTIATTRQGWVQLWKPKREEMLALLFVSNMLSTLGKTVRYETILTKRLASRLCLDLLNDSLKSWIEAHNEGYVVWSLSRSLLTGCTCDAVFS
jgi:hypothetical protein